MFLVLSGWFLTKRRSNKLWSIHWHPWRGSKQRIWRVKPNLPIHNILLLHNNARPHTNIGTRCCVVFHGFINEKIKNDLRNSINETKQFFIKKNLSLLIYENHEISFQTFFVWPLLLIVHTWIYSPLRRNLLRLQCTCTVPTTSVRPRGSPLVWACQWPSSQPLSSPQLSQIDSLWA